MKEESSTRRVCTCNGCGELKETSKEHLFAKPTIRALIGDESVPKGIVRKVGLRSGFYSGFKKYVPATLEEMGPAPLDLEIEGLLCEECNNRWASDLEDKGAREVQALLRGGKADAGLLARLGWFLGLKIVLMDGHDRQNCAGSFLPLLNPLAIGAPLPGRVLISYVTNAHFGLHRFALPPPMLRRSPIDAIRYYVWIMFGLAWVIVFPMRPDDRPLLFPAPLLEILDDGSVRLISIPALTRRQLIGWVYEPFGGARNTGPTEYAPRPITP